MTRAAQGSRADDAVLLSTQRFLFSPNARFQTNDNYKQTFTVLKTTVSKSIVSKSINKKKILQNTALTLTEVLARGLKAIQHCHATLPSIPRLHHNTARMTLYYSLVSFSPSTWNSFRFWVTSSRKDSQTRSRTYGFVLGIKNVPDLLSGFIAPIEHYSSWPECLLIKIAF